MREPGFRSALSCRSKVIGSGPVPTGTVVVPSAQLSREVLQVPATLNKMSIESTAREVLNAWAKAGGDGGAMPVDLIGLLEHLGGAIAVRYEDGVHPESLFVDEPGEFTVFVPWNTSMVRDRFTIAHEIGHYVLHYDGSGRSVAFQRYGRSRQESEANAFAGALLMPGNAFEKAWQEVDGDIASVAKLFQVSRSAAEVRRRVLGLS